MFDRNVFTAAFEGRLVALASAEKITKDSLRDLSRDLLHVTYETEDIGYINRTVEVLTPVNRKVAVAFFKAHSGFLFGEDSQKFFKKDKKRYDDVKAAALKLLDDPHFNVWTWADRNIDVAVKPFDVAKVTVFAKQALAKATKEGIPQSKLIEAFFEAGFEVDALIAAMDKLAQPAEQA